MNELYYYGITAMFYLTTCWMFAAIRWFHTCQESKDSRPYVWPDRKLQVLCYLCSIVLVPYVLNPANEAAWMLMKSYYPATYYFYCGMLMLCYAGTVKQWNRWKSVSWAAAIIVISTMLLPILNAWLPFKVMSAQGIQFWHYIIITESLMMLAFCCMAMWQVWYWIRESRDANFSNPDDFPVRYARIVAFYPIVLTPLLWPAFIFDSRQIMAIMHLLLAVFNVVLLITVMQAWRRKSILPSAEDENNEDYDAHQNDSIEEQIEQTALEIRAYVEEKKAYLDPHLRIDEVVEHCQHGRTYVSLTLQRRYGSFANYVNGLRLEHYEEYVDKHPNETKESAALASGFSSYNAYYRAKQRK